MAYASMRTIRYNTLTNLQYIHQIVDEMVTTLGQIGITATGKKFESYVDLSNTTKLSDNNMPSWISTCALSSTSSVTWCVSQFYRSKYNAGESCYGCVYWEVDGIKYVYFMGGAYTSSISSYIADTLVQYMYVDGATDTQQKLTLVSGHDNSSSDYCYLGIVNSPDIFTFGRSTTGFHMYVKGDNSSRYNLYMGHVATSYGDSIVNPLYCTMTKVPLHNNMTKDIIMRSFGTECYGMINIAEGDIPTGKYYMFDVFYGIPSGTIIGTANETKCIPYLPSSNGDVVSVGGDMYLRIGSVPNSCSSSYNQPLLVKVV